MNFINLAKKDKFYFTYLIGAFLILLLPLLSVPPLLHPSAWAKTIGLRIVFSILIFAFILEVLSKKNVFENIKSRIKTKAKIPFWLLIAYLGIFALATVFSKVPYFSFWGTPYRGGGFLTFGYCILFALFLFLTLKDKDWQKVIDIVIAVGAIVSLIAIFQKFNLFGEYLRGYSWRPVSTMGGPIFLALYLVLLMFLPLCFGIKIKGKKRIFYFISLALIATGIILSATRAAFLGLGIGLFFFLFFYPKKDKRIFWVKVFAIALIILSIAGLFWLKGQNDIVQALKQNKIFGTSFERIWSGIGEKSIIDTIAGSRIGGWTILWQGLKDRPLLGYGPENLSIAFDKHFDTNLPGITSSSSGVGAWWDRGHNFFFDISIQAGILALMIYLLLFASLFYYLQKTKKNNPEKRIIAHGLQTTFIAYLVTNFFSFDLTTTLLISFLLIGYTLFLISRENQLEIPKENKSPTLFKYLFATAGLFFLIWFVWQHNIIPLKINKEINENIHFTTLIEKTYRQGNPSLAKEQYLALLQRMEDLTKTHTFLDNYIYLRYLDVLTLGVDDIMPEKNIELSQKALEILEKSKELNPHYTRIWIYLAVYTNRLMPLSEPESEQREQLNQTVYSYAEKIKELSPKRPDHYYIWAKNRLSNEKFQEALEISEQCSATAPEYGNCYLTKGLALIGLNQYEEAIPYINKASDIRNPQDAKIIISQIITIYSKIAKKTEEIKYYEILKDLYIKMIEYEYNDFQHHASLAYIYSLLGEYDKAREEAMIVLELSPESAQVVEEFLKTLSE